MKAIVLRELSGPDKLHLEEVPDPKPGPDQVLVRLKAAALNHRDVWICYGKYPDIKLPVVLGSDGAGEVAAIGDGVDPSWVGKAVIINPGLNWGTNLAHQSPDFRILGMPDDGTFAQYTLVPATNIYPKPEGLSFEEAAAVPLASLTAYRAVVTRGQTKPGDIVLITGVGGGVSSFALQIAKAQDATVIVTSGSDEKLRRAKELGADHGFNYRSQDWASEIRKVLDGKGPDVVIDSVGGSTFAQAVELLNPGGHLVIYGATTGLPENINLRKLFWNQLNIMGSTMGSPQEFEAMLKLYGPTGIRPAIDRVYPLEEAVQAHQRMQQAEQFGKIVLKTDSPA